MNWKTRIAILLVLPIWWWCGLPPLWSTIELAENYVLYDEGEHCNTMVPHPTSLVNQPQESALLDVPLDARGPHEYLIALLPHPHAARDRPPPRFYSTSHSLRAPPTLILA
ncbi:MAG: hypothetical protein HOP22_03270 [Nitrospiraceae bacterium]|nr:hypothetical protein [Nitrospiraceae bacterium]